MGPLGHLVSEFLAAGIARVGQHPGVNPSVDEIGDPLAKTLGARLADKRSLPCVDPLVVLQGGQLLESFPTILP